MPHRRRRLAATSLLASVVSVAGAGCSDDESPEPAAVEVACDRLAALGTAILGAGSPDEVEAEVIGPFDAYVEAAHDTGDAELIGLADRARDRFDVYLTEADPLDAREAGDDADIALDRSIQRCVELGATTDFPREPASG